MDGKNNQFQVPPEKWNTLDPEQRTQVNNIIDQARKQRQTFSQGVNFPQECRSQLDQVLYNAITETALLAVNQLQTH